MERGRRGVGARLEHRRSRLEEHALMPLLLVADDVDSNTRGAAM